MRSSDLIRFRLPRRLLSHPSSSIPRCFSSWSTCECRRYLQIRYCLPHGRRFAWRVESRVLSRRPSLRRFLALITLHIPSRHPRAPARVSSCTIHAVLELLRGLADQVATRPPPGVHFSLSLPHHLIQPLINLAMTWQRLIRFTAVEDGKVRSIPAL
jgi:hypothetical protein